MLIVDDAAATGQELASAALRSSSGARRMSCPSNSRKIERAQVTVSAYQRRRLSFGFPRGAATKAAGSGGAALAAQATFRPRRRSQSTGFARASGSFSAPGRQTAELVVDVPAALQTVQRLGPQVRPNSINDRHHCAPMRLPTDPGKRRQEPEAPSVTEEHLLLQLAARRRKQYANRQFTDNR